MAESEKQIRVLYVCPRAHSRWSAHPPQAAVEESLALFKAGAEVSLFTFRGIIGQPEPEMIPHRMAVSSWTCFPLGMITRLLNTWARTQNIAWFLEQFLTLISAVRRRKSLKYDVIYLRDGDPFIFIPVLLGLVSRDRRWAISLIGVLGTRSFGSLPHRFINASFWKPLYRRSFSRNRFAFICENRYVKDNYEEGFLDGTLSGRVEVVLHGVDKADGNILKSEARRYLGLPEDKAVFLHFGALHPGKDIEVVVAAMRDISDVLLVHAGKVATAINMQDLVKRGGLQGRMIIRDYYIPAVEKQYYFTAADAVILSYKKDFVQTASVLWEAAKYGVPAIASDVGELGELVERYKIGSVFQAEDAASLRDELSRFLGSSPSEREAMVSNCARFCDDFSLDSWAQKCLVIFKDLCGQGVREEVKRA
ncbi:MAG TPA: glycosyltransferase family 4 protein [Dehalococcoidia bacterium]|nr:glycosyltransferase family 4 protein [Dehalococcoidia bacterium]